VRLRGEIRGLQKKVGVTTIMVTHDQEEALSMADRVVVMNRGELEQVGTPRDIYEQPASPFVADFVGRINVLDAVAAGTGRVPLGPAHAQGQWHTYQAGSRVRLYCGPRIA
jgi:iron(III) transport system ATP-binding protein